MLSRSGLSLGPVWLRGVNVPAELFEVQDVEVGRGMDQIDQGLLELLILVEVDKFKGNAVLKTVLSIVLTILAILLLLGLSNGHHLN